jgi:vanillate/3-O-methylgallate O-demethylase
LACCFWWPVKTKKEIDMTKATGKSLEDKMQEIGSAVEMLRHSQVGPYVFPIPAEYSNWRDEQEAWHDTAVLLDLSYHMTDIYFEGPDVYKLLSDVGVNSFKKFAANKAKQFVACNYDGYVIGDAILFGHAANKVSIVGRPSAQNWVAFNAELGDYDVKVTRDERSVANDEERLLYRFQIQGPNAYEILEKANGGSLPKIKFFNIGDLNIAGKEVRALNHGMSRTSGLEVFGPYADGKEVKAAILEAGKDLGLRQVGARAYSTVSIESGWIPSPMPAIYSGEKMKPYREWLSAEGFESNASLGGSFYSENIEDYYQTPWDLGYGHYVKFDHDFIGREALEKMAEEKHRKKVWLIWNDDDIKRVNASMFEKGDRYKYLEAPGAQYSTLPFDSVKIGDEIVGLSTYNCYTANVRRWFSLAMIDEAKAKHGAEVTIVWGEENGGSNKCTVERHVQTEIRAVISTEAFTKETLKASSGS